jgi:hypothetical protein
VAEADIFLSLGLRRVVAVFLQRAMVFCPFFLIRGAGANHRNPLCVMGSSFLVESRSGLAICIERSTPDKNNVVEGDDETIPWSRGACLGNGGVRPDGLSW